MGCLVHLNQAYAPVGHFLVFPLCDTVFIEKLWGCGVIVEGASGGNHCRLYQRHEEQRHSKATNMLTREACVVRDVPIGPWRGRQNELMRSLITHQFVSKLMPNSPILSNNYELRSIVVNKGRFQEE